MEERRLTIEPQLQVRKTDDQHWVVTGQAGNEFKIELNGSFYRCSCNTVNEPPWQECEHIQAVQQYELQHLESESAGLGFKAFADSLLWQIGQLEAEIDRNDQSADYQVRRIELWRNTENKKLEKRINGKAVLLHNYMSHTRKRTENLVNGAVRLRKQQPKITITDEFDLDQEEFVRIIPEQRKPDLRAVRRHLKETGEVLPGAEVEMQPDKLSWEVSFVYNNVIGEENESNEDTLRKAG